jgi:protein-S-isoprenylcysteine O-methyltransferase Ste14
VDIAQLQTQQRDPDRLARIGGWLFEHRTVVPLPIALPMLLIPAGSEQHAGLVIAGVVMVAAGESIRLWGVHHIGAISRTRRDRLGPLIDSGPFAIVRNPLYLGNLALWAGFALISQLLWMLPLAIALLGFEYHAIVRWEERLLESRLGDAYRAYAARVPRWIPSARARRADRDDGPAADPAYSWRQTISTERGTLIAIAVGCGLLWLKARF